MGLSIKECESEVFCRPHPVRPSLCTEIRLHCHIRVKLLRIKTPRQSSISMQISMWGSIRVRSSRSQLAQSYLRLLFHAPCLAVFQFTLSRKRFTLRQRSREWVTRRWLWSASPLDQPQSSEANNPATISAWSQARTACAPMANYSRKVQRVQTLRMAELASLRG